MKRTRRTAFALLLALCVTLGLLPALTPAASASSAADAVTYLDATVGADNTVTFTEKTCDSYVAVASGLTVWNAGWYVVNSDVTIASRITVTGDVRLILANGAELTASAGITVSEGNSLTIYAQSTDEATMGKLSATGGAYSAGIGSGDDEQSGGTITVNGGAVTATGGYGAAGIGGGSRGAGGEITVNGGAVKATGGDHGAGIGGGYEGAGGAITVNGGAVTANGGKYSAGIGGGDTGAGGAITVNGGAVTANGGSDSAGIGGGSSGGGGGTVTINGGAVTANSGGRSAGIGGGKYGASGKISITGGTVTANGAVGGGSEYGGAGIGGGENGDNSGTGNSISITGGTVTATVPNGTKGAAIGNGGGDNATDVPTVTIGEGLTVGAGTSADGTGAAVVTDVANNTSYKYAKITFPVPVSGVTLDQTSLSLTAGGSTAALTATVAPDDATDKTVTWASDNTAVATVDSSGVVTPVAAGAATITVTATNGTDDTSDDKTATCSVTVATVSVTGVTLDPTSLNLTAGGSTGTLTATFEPADASYKTVTWASDNTAVATVDSSGVVTPVAAGTATITVTATNGTDDTSDDKTATCTVTVIPSYTVTAADTVTTEKKYHHNEEITIAVTVSGADFEGGEFTLTYDKDMFQLTAEAVAPGKNDDNAKNAKTNQTGENSDGQYDFSLKNGVKLTDEDALVQLTFKVVGTVTTETNYTFAFKDNKASVCYGLTKDTVEATTVTDATVTVEPSSFDVTLTGENGVTFVNSSDETITSDTAAYGTAYTVKIGDYNALRYAYTVTLKVGGTEVTDAPSPATDGTITIPAASVTGAIELTVSRAAKFTVTITEDYVSGYSLITVAKTEANTEDTIYTYDGHDMYDVNVYNAYAYIVQGKVAEDADKVVETATEKVGLGTKSAGTISAGYDVNNTGKVDYSDSLLTYRCYIVKYETPTTAMEIYLRADVNGNKKVDTTDVSAIDAHRTTNATGTPETT